MRRTGRTFLRAAALHLLPLVLFMAGCGGTQMSTKIASPFARAGAGSGGQGDAVLREIDERNKIIEDHPEWRTKAYDQFMIRHLSALDESSYADLTRYLDNGSVYVIVHPAYYTFFHDHDLFPGHAAGYSEEGAMEMFLGDTAYSAKSRLIKAQEKMLRDFLEYMSTTKKLVVLILPHDYRKFPAYRFRERADEYMRYINEVTNESESVFYLYSKRPNRGTLTEKDRKKLLKLLYAVRAKEILVGGGYVGRCIEDFYKDVEQYYSQDRIFVVPELTAIAPADISSDAAADLLRPDNTVDVAKISAMIGKNVLGNQEIIPKTRNLRTLRLPENVTLEKE